MNMATPETVTDAFKFTEVSLHFFEHDTAKINFIDVVRQQIAEVDVGLLIIACTMVIITMTKTI